MCLADVFDSRMRGDKVSLDSSLTNLWDFSGAFFYLLVFRFLPRVTPFLSLNKIKTKKKRTSKLEYDSWFSIRKNRSLSTHPLFAIALHLLKRASLWNAMSGAQGLSWRVFIFSIRNFFRLQDSLFTLCSTCAVDGIMSIETAVNVFAVLFSFDASWKRSFCGHFAQCSYTPDLRAYFAILPTNQPDCSQRVWSRNGFPTCHLTAIAHMVCLGMGVTFLVSFFLSLFWNICKNQTETARHWGMKTFESILPVVLFFVNHFARTERLCGKTAGV